MSEHIPSPDAHQTIWAALGDKDYRHAFAEAHVGDFLASQINFMRLSRGWNQADLAEEAGISQPQVSVWENSCEGCRLASLHKIAAAFDVAFLGKFVPFSQLAREAIGVRADCRIPTFDEESPEAIKRSTVSVRMENPPRRSGRNGGGEKPYLRHVDVTGSLLTSVGGS